MKKDNSDETEEEEEVVIECSECSKELEEGDEIFECEECGEVFCEKCKEEHKCFDLDLEENNSCYICGNCEEEMYNCGSCGEYFCSGCKEEHEKVLTKEKIKSYDYENYVKEKVIEGVK